MVFDWRTVSFGAVIEELPKSSLPAGDAKPGGRYPFFCSSPNPERIDHALCAGEAIIMGTGGDATVHFGTGAFSYSTDTWAFQSSSDEVVTKYLWRWLQHRLPWISYRCFQGTGLRHLQKADVRMALLELPAAEEQFRVAAVLDMVDFAIANTEAVIAKLKQVRAGTLHDLLTRGLDPHGRLRDPKEHRKQFRESPLGLIPKDWEVQSVEALLARVPNAIRSGPFGSALLKQELRDTGIPLLGIDNVHVEKFVQNYTRFVSDDKYQELKRYTVRAKDLMITIMGTVGRCCVVPESIGIALSSKHVWTISLDFSRYSPDLACWQINFAPWVHKQFKRDEQGGVMTAIRSDTLRQLLLPVPPPGEMQAIEDSLLQFNRLIDGELTVHKKLIWLKSGLIADLLTGHVRVTEDLFPGETPA